MTKSKENFATVYLHLFWRRVLFKITKITVLQLPVKEINTCGTTLNSTNVIHTCPIDVGGLLRIRLVDVDLGCGKR